MSSNLDEAKKQRRKGPPVAMHDGRAKERWREPAAPSRGGQKLFVMPTLNCRGSTMRLLRSSTPSTGSPGKRVS